AQASSTGSSGAFANVTLAAIGDEFTVEVDGETAISITATAANQVVDAEAIDANLATNAATLNAAGITFTGSAADGNLVFNKADGSDFDVATTNDGASGGFATLADATVDNGLAAGESVTGFADLDISTAEGADNAMLAMD